MSAAQTARIKRLFIWVVFVCLLLRSNELCIAKDKNRPCPEPQVVKDPKFRPGQVWQYKTRPDEQSSTLTILRIESLPKLGAIVHVRVDKIRLRNCTGGPEPDKFKHMPFARDAIERSVLKLLKEDSDIPDFEDGYDEWRKACGGVYTITVAEAIKVGEDTFNKGLGCKPPKGG